MVELEGVAQVAQGHLLAQEGGLSREDGREAVGPGWRAPDGVLRVREQEHRVGAIGLPEGFEEGPLLAIPMSRSSASFDQLELPLGAPEALPPGPDTASLRSHIDARIAATTKAALPRLRAVVVTATTAGPPYRAFGDRAEGA